MRRALVVVGGLGELPIGLSISSSGPERTIHYPFGYPVPKIPGNRGTVVRNIRRRWKRTVANEFNWEMTSFSGWRGPSSRWHLSSTASRHHCAQRWRPERSGIFFWSRKTSFLDEERWWLHLNHDLLVLSKLLNVNCTTIPAKRRSI